MAKIICIGSATKDIFFPTDEGIVLETPADVEARRKIAFELGAKYHIMVRHEELGGCAANVATGLCRQGHESVCLVALGGDETSSWIRACLEREGVDMSLAQEFQAQVSDLSAIIVDEKSGERTIFSNHGASKELVVDLENEKGWECDWLFVGDLSGNWKGNLQAAIAAARRNSVQVAFNPRQQMLHEDIAYVLNAAKDCDLLFVNKDEATELALGLGVDREAAELENENFLLGELAKACPHATIALTDGERGAWAVSSGRFFHAEAFLRKAVDTTGAGDAFASGMLGAIIKGKGIEEALSWGIKNSSSSIMFYGGTKGLLDGDSLAAEF
ncbi:MAG TPA: carbohydrate kinase family protein [Candidatus Moranbacteria bacterium]|nr:carbohydrate kinase family protein [Candidatus Moranbacteria bacterium]